MPTYIVRLEAPDTEHYRETNIQAPDEDTAVRWLEEREADLAAHRLTPERIKSLADEAGVDNLAALKVGSDNFRALPASVRAQLAAHHQAEPYEIVSVKEKK
jgi:hypothetical protein